MVIIVVMKIVNNSIALGKKWRLILVLPLFYLASMLIINVIGEKKDLTIPVRGATYKNWDKLSFWYYPWGKSGVHKGIDIFAPHKTPVISPINGFLLSSGYSENGGNFIYIIGSNLRIYYFAHLNELKVKNLRHIKKDQLIGTIGNTGNAIGKPYHLHFSIFSLVPIIKNYDRYEYEAWRKMFYLNPNNLLHEK